MSRSPTPPRRRSVHRWTPPVVLLAVVVVALLFRWHFVDVTSGDYRAFVDPWYQQLAAGGFRTLGEEFANYNSPYLVLLWVATKLPLSEIVAVKLLSVLFDLLLATVVHRVVRQLRPDSAWAPTVVTSVALLLPTVVMNGAVWGQCDSIYATFCAAGVYFLLRRRPWAAAALLGVAFGFKLQALFLLPVLVAVFLLNRHRLRALIALPAAFAATLVPAWLAGRSWASQLAVYPAQVVGSGGIGSGSGSGSGAVNPTSPGRAAGGPGFGGPGSGGPAQAGSGSTGAGTSSLTHNAPTPYAWLPADASHGWAYVGLLLTAVVVAAVGIWLLRRRRPLGGADVVLLAAVAALVIPLLLPGMHERYFYLAEVLLVVAGAVDRRFVLPALGLQSASSATYLSYLVNQTAVPLSVSAALALGSGLVAVALLVTRLRTGGQAPLTGHAAAPIRAARPAQVS
jgi:Gpi18-like mannosyltransferase